MRSLFVVVYELNVDEVCVIGYYDCGMSKISSESMFNRIKERGILEECIEILKYFGVDFD